jgi:hypothetical protein
MNEETSALIATLTDEIFVLSAALHLMSKTGSDLPALIGKCNEAAERCQSLLDRIQTLRWDVSVAS